MFISNMLWIMIGQTINWGCDIYLMVKWIVIYVYIYICIQYMICIKTVDAKINIYI